MTLKTSEELIVKIFIYKFSLASITYIRVLKIFEFVINLFLGRLFQIFSVCMKNPPNVLYKGGFLKMISGL
jgi:hypothetical protein